MSTPLRVGAFAAVLAVLFGAAFGAGKLFADDEAAAATYSLRLTAGQGDAAGETEIRFSVVRDHDVVTGFATRHEKELHLIAVREDFGGYRHLHPVMDPQGAWSVDAELLPGRWRIFADFQPAGADPVVVHEDVTVAGDPGPTPAATDSLRQSVHGYDVDLAWAGSGAERQAVFTVSRDGRPVDDLEPYLGAFGHLVVLTDPDREFLHVHPEDGPAGPSVAFSVGATSKVRLYFEFQHEGAVHTVPFATAVAGSGGEHQDGGGGHGEH